ncbi:hypothetical protein V6N12_059123 [Hibiscus sabdariffa]|uniref:ADP-ribosylation factor n=1 Tax=Hibiscus sabdariffa TaxID=183260 RepID=A0ABR2EUQ5_9ROSI
MRILMVGLDAAGKTTVLYKLKLGDIVTTIPTIGFNVETVESGTDPLRFWEGLLSPARDELHRMLNEDELRDAVLLVLANNATGKMNHFLSLALMVYICGSAYNPYKISSFVRLNTSPSPPNNTRIRDQIQVSSSFLIS